MQLPLQISDLVHELPGMLPDSRQLLRAPPRGVVDSSGSAVEPLELLAGAGRAHQARDPGAELERHQRIGLPGGFPGRLVRLSIGHQALGRRHEHGEEQGLLAQQLPDEVVRPLEPHQRAFELLPRFRKAHIGRAEHSHGLVGVRLDGVDLASEGVVDAEVRPEPPVLPRRQRHRGTPIWGPVVLGVIVEVGMPGRAALDELLLVVLKLLAVGSREGRIVGERDPSLPQGVGEFLVALVHHCLALQDLPDLVLELHLVPARLDDVVVEREVLGAHAVQLSHELLALLAELGNLVLVLTGVEGGVHRAAGPAVLAGHEDRGGRVGMGRPLVLADLRVLGGQAVLHDLELALQLGCLQRPVLELALCHRSRFCGGVELVLDAVEDHLCHRARKSVTRTATRRLHPSCRSPYGKKKRLRAECKVEAEGFSPGCDAAPPS